jgi:hypothetical protein
MCVAMSSDENASNRKSKITSESPFLFLFCDSYKFDHFWLSFLWLKQHLHWCLLSQKTQVKATALLLTLAPWSVLQLEGWLPFVVVMPKKPRQVQSVLLQLASSAAINANVYAALVKRDSVKKCHISRSHKKIEKWWIRNDLMVI